MQVAVVTLGYAAGFLLYVVAALAVTLYLMTYVAPVHGTSSIYVYITICSLMGSLSVMSCKVCTLVYSAEWNKLSVCLLQDREHQSSAVHSDALLLLRAWLLQALGISLKLSFEGDNQFGHPQLYFCILVSNFGSRNMHSDCDRFLNCMIAKSTENAAYCFSDWQAVLCRWWVYAS